MEKKYITCIKNHAKNIKRKRGRKNELVLDATDRSMRLRDAAIVTTM